MSIDYAAGLVIGIITALLIFYIVGKTNKKNMKGHYDERQELVRGRGYKYASFTLLILLAVYMLAEESGIFASLPLTHSFAAFAILIVGVLVYALYCISNDAYLGVGNDGRAYKRMMWVVVILNILPLARTIYEGELFEAGKLGFGGGSNLLFLIAFAVILIDMEARSRRLRREEESDEES